MAASDHCGILNVNKLAKVTSRQAVNRCQRLMKIKKIGHAGTLDPMATGVLVICVGPTTRLIQFVQRYPKSYRAQFKLGTRSDTDDIWGNLVDDSDRPPPSLAELTEALQAQIGKIRQKPPIYSALKIGGHRSHSLARQGKPVTLAEREVEITSIKLERFEFPYVDLTICCGSGTYIRSIARDVGQALGCGAVMSQLCRTAIGPFHIDTAVTLDKIESGFTRYLIPAEEAFPDVRKVVLDRRQWQELKHGRSIQMAHTNEQTELIALTPEGKFAAWLVSSIQAPALPTKDAAWSIKGEIGRAPDSAIYRAIVNWVPSLDQ